jgi:2,3-bisphosphoglycerate-independent phosphoglycerate mutase
MFSLFGKKQPAVRPVILLVLDGFGLAPASAGNAITSAKTPTFDMLKKNYPYSELIASGESVGLPANEVGNSEVGHLTLGAGRIILQSLKRINLAIADASFYQNDALLRAVEFVRKNSSTLHIIGLASSGNVHSSLPHLFALLELCRKNRVDKVRLHLFTDGRDAPPEEGAKIIAEVEDKIERLGVGKIATVSGRYFAMDRDRHWERTEKVYKAITFGIGNLAENAVDAISASYAKGVTDEFIEPIVITKDGKPVGIASDGDAIIMFNFRIDRPRQLAMAFSLQDFEDLKSFKLGYDPDQGTKTTEEISGATFVRGKILKNVFFVTMTEYQPNLPAVVAFPPTPVSGTFAETIAAAGVSQIHLAESEKERMVTYYFDGLRETGFANEETVIVPSPRVATYDKKPEMSLKPLVNECIKAVGSDRFGFVVINFANPDMVAHTGNLAQSIKAIEYVDHHLGRFYKAVSDVNGIMMITADHGNAEELLTYPTTSYFYTAEAGEMNTDHSNNPVPVFLICREFAGRKNILNKGSLSDVAPTLLAIMQIPKPAVMTGQSLLNFSNANNTV